MMDPARTRWLDLLDSPSATWRLEGIDRVREDGLTEAIPRLVEMLGDEAPYVFDHGRRRMVAEVRFAALAALEHLYRLVGRPPDFGPVRVRKATPARAAEDQAAAVLAGMSAAARDELLARVDAWLVARVDPPEADRPACRAWRVLQELGLVSYRVEEVDPRTYLTPLQAEVARSQTAAPRPLPHLAVASRADPGRVLGFVYRDEAGRWQLDFAEDDEAVAAARYVGQVRTIERGGLPRVARGSTGRPVIDAEGAFVLDGVVPDATPQPAEWLRSLAAFVDRRYSARVVEGLE